MASERIEIWSENTPQQISVNSEKTPQSIGVKNSSITVLDNNYDNIANKPSINGVTLQGNKTSRDLGLTTETDRLAKEINDLNNSLSTVSKSGSYDDLSEKPSINGVPLTGNKTSEDLHIQGGKAEWGQITGQINSQLDLKNALDSKVPVDRTINGKPLSQNITLTAVDVGATLYQANWLFGSPIATQENFDALEFAIVNNVPVTARSGAGVTYLMTNVSANSAGLYVSTGNVLTETVGDVTHEIARGNEWFIDRTTLEITYTSPTIDKQALEAAIAANSADITYTSTTVENRVVTQETVTEPVQGTKPISSYGPFNYIPLDMSHYTSGAANKALLPEKHLPSGAYVVTVAGYMRLGTETKQLQPGHIIFWDTESGELDLLGYNACEYWGYDSQNETWEGGYFTTASDVEYMIEEKMPAWVKISNGMFIVASKDTGYYTFAYSSATGTSRRIRIDVEGTSEYYYPYNDTVLIKSETGVLMLGRYNLWFAYDSTNNYYKQPIDFTTIQSQLDALDARITALGG